MSPKACLVALVALPACIEPAVQGTSEPTPQTTSGATDPTSTTDPATSSPASTGSPTTDATTTGPAPTCSDGQLNQDESDVDCGGPCPPCDADAMCGDDDDCKSGECDAGACFPLHPSCLQLLMARPGLPSAAYPLDPDGDGVNPLPFFCDMEGGGWTQVFIDELKDAPSDAWDPKPTAECGAAIGSFLGPFGMGQSAFLSITAQQVPHTELRLVAEAVILDSWDQFDQDTLIVRLDGAEIYTQGCDHTVEPTCGQKDDICANGTFPDAELLVTPAPAAHMQDAIGLEFTSELNEAIDNEAWGLDKVVVFVK